jgi:SAM-dependent methyltransferase
MPHRATLDRMSNLPNHPPHPHCIVCGAADARPFARLDGRHYWRCDICLATWLAPAERLPLAAERAHYALHENDPDDSEYRCFLAPLAEPLLARLPPASSGLDYGCGPGPALAAMLREAGHRVALWDPCFAPDRQVLDTTYDFVTCSETAEHFHWPAVEFTRMDALLRPGGWLAVMTGLLVDDAAFAGWHYRRDPTHVVFYQETTFRHLATRFGWRFEAPARNVVLLQKQRAVSDD